MLKPDPSADLPRSGGQPTLIDEESSTTDAKLWVTVVEGPHARLLRLPPSGRLSIGREPTCDIVLETPSVSRRHATLVIAERGVAICDEGSANGTRVGGSRVPAHTDLPVGPGIAIFVGGASLVVHELSPGARTRTREREEREATLAGEHIEALRAREPGSAPGMVVQAATMRRLYELVERVAAGTISVLLVGETGVGKEVVASAVHNRSPRRQNPFLRLNCAALSEHLLESELFGHEAGAFTGARAAKPGLLETADGGTILLDEIGELPMAIQAKLLRVIETREVTRVGGTRIRQLDVRFVSATNRDLQARAQAGSFREDLYFRLSGVTLNIPPLRDRVEEIEPLATEFARQAALALGRPHTPHLAAEAIDHLKSRRWPGNVRELRNCVERAVLLSSSDAIDLADVDPRGLTQQRASSTRNVAAPLPVAPEQTDAVDERARIEAALAACAGNQTRAAERLGIARRTLVKKLAEYRIPRPRVHR
jgi:DNA-binding NtrC family response regulator